MFYILSGVITRIVSNSYLNVFQKTLTQEGNRPSVVNFYTYLGLTILSLFFVFSINIQNTNTLLVNFILMGILGALGNYYIIKALSLGELSTLAPINSYKPLVAILVSFFYLKEIPSLSAIFGIVLIILGTYILYNKGEYNSKAVFYRVLALIFSGTEAVFIKKIILLTDIPTSFVLWALSGLIFSVFFTLGDKNCFKLPQIKPLIMLILSVGIMQYSTNFVFSKINVSYALALFQLSTLLSVILGAKIFHETGLKRKVIASLIMIFGAIVIIVS